MTLREQCRLKAGEFKESSNRDKVSKVMSTVIEQGQVNSRNDCAGRYARYSKFAP